VASPIIYKGQRRLALCGTGAGQSERPEPRRTLARQWQAMGRIEHPLLDGAGVVHPIRCPKPFARNHTIPQKVTDVSIYDKGPGLLAHQHIRNVSWKSGRIGELSVMSSPLLKVVGRDTRKDTPAQALLTSRSAARTGCPRPPGPPRRSRTP
jgi:hypothetical protein